MLLLRQAGAPRWLLSRFCSVGWGKNHVERRTRNCSMNSPKDPFSSTKFDLFLGTRVYVFPISPLTCCAVQRAPQSTAINIKSPLFAHFFHVIALLPSLIRFSVLVFFFRCRRTLRVSVSVYLSIRRRRRREGSFFISVRSLPTANALLSSREIIELEKNVFRKLKREMGKEIRELKKIQTYFFFREQMISQGDPTRIHAGEGSLYQKRGIKNAKT